MIDIGRHLNIPRTERYCKKFNTQRNIFNEKISNILENAS